MNLDTHPLPRVRQHRGTLAAKVGFFLFVFYLITSCSNPTAPLSFDALTYQDEGREITITGLARRDITDLSIPSFIHNKPVTAIAEAAFKNSTLTSINIPNSVTTIGDEAFNSAASLSEVQIGNGITSIGNLAFAGTALNKLTILAPKAPSFIGSPAEAFPAPLTGITLLYPIGETTGYTEGLWSGFGGPERALDPAIIENIRQAYQSLIITLKPLPGVSITVEAHTEADFSSEATATAVSEPTATTSQEISLTGLTDGTSYRLRAKGNQVSPEASTDWITLPNPYSPHGIVITDAVPRSGKIMVEVGVPLGLEAELQAFTDQALNIMVKKVSFTGSPGPQTVELSGVSNETAYYLHAQLSDGSAEYRYTTPLIPTADGKQYIHRLSELAKIGVDTENYPDNWNYELSMDLNFADADNDGIRDDPFDSDDDADNGNWTPLSPGTYDDDGNYLSGGYAGNFDGKNHSIEGMTVTTPEADGVGFFGATVTGGSEIKDLGLIGGSVLGYRDVGALVGRSWATISGSYAAASVTGSSSVGGLTGSSSGSIRDSYSTGDVSGQGNNVGGLAGSSGGSIRDSYSTGDVSGQGSHVGGLAGSSGGSIRDSYSTGDVSGQGSGVGGLVGSYNSIASSITGSYATGDVSGQDKYVGGLVGQLTAHITGSYATGDVSGQGSQVGGLIGFLDGGTLTNSYATGNVLGQRDTTQVGGLVGTIRAPGTITNSYRYANQSITAPDGNAHPTPSTLGSTVSLDQLKTPSWYTGTNTGRLGWSANDWVIEGRVDGSPAYHPHINNFPGQPDTPLPTP